MTEAQFFITLRKAITTPMNVTELARQLKLSVEITRHIIPRVGFDIGLKAIKVEDKIAYQIIERVKKSPHLITEVEIELGLRKPSEEKKELQESKSKQVLQIPDHIAVRELAALVHKPVTEVIAELMKNGIFANLNEDIDFETATIIAEDMGFKAERMEKRENAGDDAEQKIEDIIKEDKTKIQRPPVIVIMGHVDHGKTKLLDAIRKSHIVESEAGGITQHIGAYQIEHKGRKITFIDTPGHEAFTAMRSRGANVADIAILVIAWDEGIKPQTTEAINIIKKTGLPFIVALTKMDKEGSNPEKVFQQLAELNYLPEKWGGQTIVAPVSAVNRNGLDELLNILLLRADLEQEKITADPTRPGVGTIIESHVDRGEGPVASVIVQTGTLRTGDLITAGEVAGKVKLLKNDMGEEIIEAPPGTPVRILGLKELPAVGDILQVTGDKKALKKVLKAQKIRSQALQERQTKIIQQAGEEGKIKDRTYTIILKTDNAGSQEAIAESLEKLPRGHVKVQIARKDIGPVNESDIAEASSIDAVIYAFHMKVPPTIKEVAKSEGTQVREFDIIYKLIEDIIAELESRMPPEVTRTTEAIISVSALFQNKGKTQIVGGLVQQGKAATSLHVKIRRGKVDIGNGLVSELRLGPRVVDSVTSGTECGIKIDRVPEIRIGDILELYSESVRTRKLIE